MTFSKNDFAKATQANSDIIDSYAHWGELLIKWNARINLVAPSTLSDFWGRHAYDSWQITPHIKPDVERLIDLGSGAGFPGLSAAIDMKARGKGHVWLVESVGKKVNFMRTVIRELSLPATVIAERAEAITIETMDCITARAFAPLPRLLTYAQRFWGHDTYGLFLKGQGLADEILAVQDDWVFSHELHPSISDDTGLILELHGLKHREEAMI